MATTLRKAALCFSAGCAGGLTNSVAVWLFGTAGITGALGVELAPDFTPEWLYPRVVWGGLWGFLFLIPVLQGSVFLRGLLWSLGPTAVQLLVVFPQVAEKGLFGLDLGGWTPLFVVIFNAIWGWTAAVLLVWMEPQAGAVRG